VVRGTTPAPAPKAEPPQPAAPEHDPAAADDLGFFDEPAEAPRLVQLTVRIPSELRARLRTVAARRAQHGFRSGSTVADIVETAVRAALERLEARMGDTRETGQYRG